MKILLRSLKNEKGNIYIGIREDVTSIIRRSKHDTIVHLLNKNSEHITGYSLIRINSEGIMKFKKIGYIGAHVENRTPKSLDRISLDKDRKLFIIGVDLL